jgi:adenine-specific DNA-methyltransferase
MDKLKMHSPDITQQNIDKLLELFPNCKTEKQDANGGLGIGVDFDLLKQELSKNIVEGPQERYQLNWPGKKEALLTANAPIAKTLRPCREESVDFDTTENLFIEGDNLDALKLLQESYLGKVKMIYIDPPYNTGKDFIYADNFAESSDEYLQESGQKDDVGNRLVANTDSNGRFHSDWLSMIYPRLRLARNLLKDDGLIFISIDDNEIKNMRSICDEIFGGNNFIVCIAWQKIYSGKADATHFGQFHEYILCYAKNEIEIKINMLPRTVEMDARYTNPDNDPRGVWLSNDLTAAEERTNGHFDLISPSGNVFDAPKGKHWLYAESKMKELLHDNRIWFGVKGDAYPRLKRFLCDVQQGRKPPSVWLHSEVGHTDAATKEVKGIFPEFSRLFETPKPTRLIKQLLDIGIVEENEIVLDFFAGSATTAHSVMLLNKEKGKKCKYILVQLPEVCDEKSAAYQAGFGNVAEISKERARRAGKRIKEENSDASDLDTGFRVLKIDSSNVNDVHYTPDAVSKGDLFNQVEHIKTERSSEDLLFQVMLDWGVDLSLPIRKESIEDKEVYFVNDDDLVACFDKDIDEALIKALAAKKPLRVVFRDDGFVSDSVKINVEQILKQLAPATDIKAI